jgi:hypothetical protein
LASKPSLNLSGNIGQINSNPEGKTPPMTNFTKQWLAHARITDDPAGDLIADMRREQETMPSLFKNIREMRAYLVSRRACPEALEAVSTVWRRYSSWIMRNPTATPSMTHDAL